MQHPGPKIDVNEAQRVYLAESPLRSCSRPIAMASDTGATVPARYLGQGKAEGAGDAPASKFVPFV